MKLLEEVRHVARLRRLALPTERCYVRWIELYIRFHKTAAGFRHPNTMGADEVERYLTFLAVQRHVSASTQNQAFAALLFLYRDVLHLDLGDVDALRARRTRRIPVVLTREEVGALLAGLDALPTREPYGLMARLMYGAGLRLMECCRLRVKDVDQKRGQLVVRQGKGDKDRVVMLPAAASEAVAEQLRWRLALHEQDAVLSRLAISVRLAAARARPAQRPSRAPPCFSLGRPARRLRGRAVARMNQARQLSHASAQLRHASSRKGARHSHSAGTARTRGHEHNHDLHARADEWGGQRVESAGLHRGLPGASLVSGASIVLLRSIPRLSRSFPKCNCFFLATAARSVRLVTTRRLPSSAHRRPEPC